MNKIISIVGIVLIIAAGALAAISSSHEDLLNSKKELCAKYTKDAKAALDQKDFTKAMKFAKLAIKADPENKSGYAILSQITEAQCSGKVPSNTATKPATNKATTKPAPAEEEEMGC